MNVENWQFPTVIIECARCARRKEWSRERFLAEFRGMMLPDVLRAVATDCERTERLSARPCQAVYPQLSPGMTKAPDFSGASHSNQAHNHKQDHDDVSD